MLGGLCGGLVYRGGLKFAWFYTVGIIFSYCLLGGPVRVVQNFSGLTVLGRVVLFLVTSLEGYC